MHEAQKNFKSPPKKYQPRGLSILYEDRDIIVADKMSGLLTIATEKVRENTAYFLMNNYVRKGNSKSRNRIFIVHRLDRDTSGVLIFAKSEEAKHYLQDEWESVTKKYYAVVDGKLPEEEDIITSYLAESPVHKMYSVDDPSRGVFAKTGYKVLRTSKNYSLVEIDLYTGKKNQIRVHLSEAGCPIAGDKIYGRKVKSAKRLTLHAGSITISHPYSHEKMTFESKIPPYFKTLLKH